MIHEFRNPIPVHTDIGYGWLAAKEGKPSV